jgi:alcohol-forming fatty acyl-CoA reductase
MVYDQVNAMNKLDLDHYTKTILGNFPNTYTFTKRMAEHMLAERNKKNIPLLIVRPSIVGASLEEPFPGWTDSITLAGGIYLVAGLGILRELPGDENMIGDQIPVDIVANQILLQLPLCVYQHRQTANPLMITHCSTSSVNPVIWKEVVSYIQSYLYRSPYESRVFDPTITFIPNKKLYQTSFKLRRKLPATAAYQVAKVMPLVSSKTREDLKKLKEAVDKCEEIGEAFEYFTGNEWIFDNKRAMQLYYSPLISEQERKAFNCDVMRINWKMYMMNWAYGIKRFILKEEAELPSVGYNDVITVSELAY